jgi:ABC-type Fe3+-hydroxamate transport system substrate-binding protein
MQKVIDQTGREVEIPDFPQRIISLVPSQTELLFDLGLGDRVVGITKFCVHPNEWFKTKTRVGGTKIIRHGVIDALQPDLIIGNKEENTEDDIARLSKNYPVWVSDVRTLDSAMEMIFAIGQLTQTGPLAAGINTEIRDRFTQLLPAKTYRTLYLIWRKPFMAVGKNTFVDDMLMRCGLINCLETERYPELQPNDIRDLNPEVVLLSSEPYPYKEQHIAEIKRLLPEANVQLVDGEPFSWYGSRVLNSVSYFNKLLSLLP